MRHGNLQSHQARKVALCRYCNDNIEVGEFYLSLNYRTKKTTWFARRFHADCLRFWLLDEYEKDKNKAKKGSAGHRGGRPIIDIKPEQKKRRRKLLQYLNTRDVRGLINAYNWVPVKKDKIKAQKLRMLDHIDQLEEIGVPYPQPFKSQELWLIMIDHEPKLIKALEATDSWQERIEILRSSVDD